MKKPPLCKGRWAEERGSEGLYNQVMIREENNPSVIRSYLTDDSLRPSLQS